MTYCLYLTLKTGEGDLNLVLHSTMHGEAIIKKNSQEQQNVVFWGGTKTCNAAVRAVGNMCWPETHTTGRKMVSQPAPFGGSTRRTFALPKIIIISSVERSKIKPRDPVTR